MMLFNHLKSHIEALLFASGQPLSIEKITEILEISQEQAALLVEKLREEMSVNELRGIMIVEVAGGYQMCTKPSLAEVVGKLADFQESRLSAAAMETLSIIAFKQPITRQEIEAIRGVKAERVLNTLLERRLIKEVGRRDAVGRPILYGTTEDFLICFGLKDLEQLPKLADMLPEVSK